MSDWTDVVREKRARFRKTDPEVDRFIDDRYLSTELSGAVALLTARGRTIDDLRLAQQHIEREIMRLSDNATRY